MILSLTTSGKSSGVDIKSGEFFKGARRSGLWPSDPSYLWHGMSVYALDGSKFDLPATEELRKTFDPQSGFQHEGRSHYPQCLVTTAYDVYRQLPVARSVVSIQASEREQAQALLPCIPPRSFLLFDRGYPSYELMSVFTIIDGLVLSLNDGVRQR